MLRMKSSLGGGSSREGMEKAPVTAATGVLGPVIAKLAALLGSEYKLRWRTRRDVKFIRSKLMPVHSLLWDTWEKEDVDAASKALKMQALDLADDMEEAIDDFILTMERSHGSKRFVQTRMNARPFRDLKKQASDVSGRSRAKWKKKPTAGGKLTVDSSPGKPRAYPFVRKDASELVGMVGLRDKLAQHLVGKDESKPVQLQLKTASIVGMAGMGKSTLARLVYDKIEERFQVRAFVTLTPGGNMKDVLARILEQVEGHGNVPLAGTEVSTEEHLINIISNVLKDKRYLVVVDDIWNLREYEIIMKSLLENNLGSRVVGTTRMNDVSLKWHYDGYRSSDALVHEFLPDWDPWEERWFYKIAEENIATRMISMKDDLVADGFDYEHPIVHMCGGIPLALLCMLSAVTQEREKQAQQGLHLNTCDVQDKIEKHVEENGIQNTVGFEPFVQSLQLGYDDLPHHMIKTCLLYCSIYPNGHMFEAHDLVSCWLSEGFVDEEEEANGYFQELINREGFFLRSRMHPMMRNFLRWKSRQDGFTTCSSEITSSYIGTSRIRRLCIDNSPCDFLVDEDDPLSMLNMRHIRALFVYKGIERVHLEDLEGLRVLDLCWITNVLDDHLNDICGLARLRHLLGLNWDRIGETPLDIERIKCLETFQVCLSGSKMSRLIGFIGNLQQLKVLEMRGIGIRELPREIGALQQLEALRIRHTGITVLPREICALQKLKTLDMYYTTIHELPKEIMSLQQLMTLDITCTCITVLPKGIGKLQCLQQLLMSGSRVAKLPREIGLLKGLKRLELAGSIVAVPLEVCQVSALVEFPECIHQALKKSGVTCELAGEMLSFQVSGGLVVGAKQMCIPPWIKEHFNDLVSLDIRVCKLEEEGLKILREMPELLDLKLRFETVPREPIVISREGFASLTSLTIESRVPRVSFQEGSMPLLRRLLFEFQFYSGPPNKDHVGINHLRNVESIQFICNKDWYEGGDAPCIVPTIDAVCTEGQDHPGFSFEVSGRRTEYVGNIIEWPEVGSDPQSPRRWARRREE